MSSTYSVREQSLALLANFGPEYDVPDLPGLSNHGPMVVDALIALGHDAQVLPWVQSYIRKLAPMPAAANVVSAIDWQRALGQADRWSDWVGFFQRQLLWMSWEDLIAEWVPILSPGLAGAAGHGLLRTAHAVRGMSDDPTELERIELAHGLAYWASSFLPLPGCPLPRHRTAEQPIEILRRVAPGRTGNGLISEDLAALADHPGIMAATVALDTSGDPLFLVASLAEAAALSLLSNPSPDRVIAQVHGITVSVALLHLLPYVPSYAIAPTLTYGWQFVVALHAVTHDGQPFPNAVAKMDEHSFIDLVETCVRSSDEHLIKLADAAVRIRDRDTGAVAAALGTAFSLLR